MIAKENISNWYEWAYILGWECIALCAIGGCLLVIYTPKRASNASVPVNSHLNVICGLGAGTCKITQASIAVEAFGHCGS